MGNLLQYTDKSKTIDNKLNALLSEIKHDYENGVIRTETEYYYRIKSMIASFYETLNKPSFKFRPALGAPISKDYNSMIVESYNDMKYIIDDCQMLSDSITQSFTDAELNRTMMTNELANLSKKIITIGESIALNQPAGTVVFTELFNNLEMVGNLHSSKSCNVNTSDGILTLRQNGATSAKISNIEIDSSVSNGFPGNTHCVDTLNGEMNFIGQNGLHIDLNDMCDSNKDTWFEFELFSASETTRQECNSFGFDYDEGVSWVNNNDYLKLKLILTLETPEPCSWLSLNPYLSDIKGIKPAYIEECNIITESNNIYQVAKNRMFEGNMVLMFPSQKIKKIEIMLVQKAWYNTKAGHFYFTSVNTKSMSIFQEFDTNDIYVRTNGPAPSVNLLGVKYDPSTKWIKYPDSGTELLTEEYIKDKLFKLPESTIDRKAGQELVDVYRYMIGIREIKASSCIFADYSEYVSNVFETDDTITSIVLESEEYIPGNNPEILQYYLTFDGGTNWHKIYPTHRAYNGIYRYTINNDSIENLLTTEKKNKKSKNINILTDVKKVQLKITMDRPVDILTDKINGIENSEYATPVVYGYKLKIQTGGETIEY
jgi:hypothetical protein